MPYFDHNATTPMSPEARAALSSALDDAWQNPSSPYRSSARVHRLLEDAREAAAECLQASAEEIVFTGGATEANNAVVAWASRELPEGRKALISRTEHPSVLEAAINGFGERIQWLDVDPDGLVDFEKLRELIVGGGIGFVAAMAANNETGVIGRAAQVASVCRQAGVYYLCDASQWIGRLPASELPAHAFVVGCAHKFGGPKGVGLLRVPKNVGGFRGAMGGEQERRRRAGTENYPAIAAMAAALQFSESQDSGERMHWRDEFVSAVTAGVSGSRVVGAGADRLWNTVSLCMPRHENTRWVTRLDKAGHQVSTGSACATGSEAPSHVLASMGFEPEDARRTIRVSAGWETTREEWGALAEAIVDLAKSDW